MLTIHGWEARNVKNRKARATLAFGTVLALSAAAPTVALAQGTIVPEATAQPSEAMAQPATTAQPAATAAQAAATTATSQAATTATSQAATQGTSTETSTAPAQQAPVYTAAPPVPAVSAQGQWVYTDQYGYIWVPEGSSTVYVQEQPYVYLYTPTYGWTWYGSPWGPGRYYYGPWVHRAWGAPRVWHRGGWYAPHVVVAPHVVGPRVYRGGGGYGHAGGGHRGGHR
jgi:hypothetical protein